MTCSNVLLNAEGVVKIGTTQIMLKNIHQHNGLGTQECCIAISPSSEEKALDVMAVSFIAMDLMQKDAQDDGAIGVESLIRWPLK